MSAGQLTPLIQRVRQLAILRDGGGLTDAELLGAFLAHHDEVAFEVLVRRHGPMVLGVCRRVLANVQDAEDAFQATFLVLVRKAASVVPREAVGNWLYGVAYRTALAARRASLRRGAKEKQVKEMPHPQVESEETWEGLQPLLDQELTRLPDKYRLPLVLCDLEGRTRREVARELKIPEGTLSNRLATARKLLAKRLARRGVSFSGGAIATILSQNAASACLPASLVGSTVKAASSIAAGKAVGTAIVSAKVAALAEGVAKAMFITKLKTVVAVVVVLGIACFGGGLLAQRTAVAQTGQVEKVEAQRAVSRAPAPKDQRAGQAKAQAKAFLERALQVADKLPDDREKAELLRAAAVSRLKAGDRKGHDELLAKALRVVDALPEDRKGNNAQEDLRDVYKAWFLTELAGLQAQAGDPDLARRTACAIPIPRGYGDGLYFKAQALGKVASAQAEAGDIQGARKTVKQIEEDDIYKGRMRSAKEFPLFCIATAQVKAGDVKGALATAEDIGPLQLRVWALSRVAVAQGMAKDEKGSIRSLERALEFARKMPPPRGGWDERDGSTENAIGHIIEARAVTGDVKGARKLAEDLQEQEKGFLPPGQKKEFRLFWAFLLLGQRQAAAGDVESARKTGDTLLPKGSRERGELLLAIVKAQLAAGNAKGALETVAAIAHWEERALALVAIGRSHASQGQPARAAKALRDARSLVGEHKAVETRSRILIDLAVAMAESGDLQGDFTWIHDRHSPREKVYAFLAVSEALEAQAKEKAPQKKVGSDHSRAPSSPVTKEKRHACGSEKGSGVVSRQ